MSSQASRFLGTVRFVNTYGVLELHAMKTETKKNLRLLYSRAEHAAAHQPQDPIPHLNTLLSAGCAVVTLHLLYASAISQKSGDR